MSLQERIKGWANYPAFKDKDFAELGAFIAQERKKHTVYPDRENIFRAFEMTPPDEVKVVILGQDPYHDGSATGLAFECGKGITPSMEKIIEVYNRDLPVGFAAHMYDGKLHTWAENGVLLLNASLTVRAGEPGSHTLRWRKFTASVLDSLIFDQAPKVFMVWGSSAKVSLPKVERPHLGIYCEHPAKACYERRHWDAIGIFKKANEFLDRTGRGKIDW